MPHFLPRFLALCLDVEMSGECATHLKPFRMLISGTLQPFPKTVTKGCLKRPRGSLPSTPLRWVAVRRRLVVCLLAAFWFQENLTAENKLTLRQPFAAKKATPSLRAAFNKFLRLRTQDGCPALTVPSRWLKHRTDRKPHLPWGPSKFTFTSRANAISLTAFSFGPLSSINGLNVHGTQARVPL